MLVFIPRELERNAIAGIGFIFPLIGAGLLAWAVTLTLRWRRFGPSWFEMAMPHRLVESAPGRFARGSSGQRVERTVSS